MSRSLQSDRIKFRLLALLAFAGIGLVWSQVKPVVDHQRQTRAASLAGEADLLKNSDPEKSISDLYLARAFDAGNHDYSNRLADLLLVANRPDEAISGLARLPQGESAQRIAQIQFDERDYKASLHTLAGLVDSNDVAVFNLQAKNYLELNQMENAIKSGKQAFDTSSDQGALILGLGYLIAGDRTAFDVFKPSVTSTEALGRLQRAGSSNTALAQEAYDLGLVNCVGRILEGSLANSQAYTLMAEAKLATKPNQTALKDLVSTLGQGIDKDPGNLLLHELRLEAAQKANDGGVVSHEQQLIEQLESGRV